MPSSNEIVLFRCANGWIVTLPNQESYDPFAKQMEGMVKVIKEAQGTDNEIEEIKRRNEEREPAIGDIGIPKINVQANVHVFPSFSEVLSFLKFLDLDAAAPK